MTSLRDCQVFWRVTNRKRFRQVRKNWRWLQTKLGIDWSLSAWNSFRRKRRENLLKKRRRRRGRKSTSRRSTREKRCQIIICNMSTREKGQTKMTPCSLSISLIATDCYAKLLTFAGSSKYPGQVRDRKETAHKQKWQAEGGHDGGAEEGVWAGWWRCQRTWGQDEESMKSWNRISVFRLGTTFFQDAAERDAAKEKVEQKMEVTLRHYKSMIINHPLYSRCGRWRRSWRRTLEWTNASSNDNWGTLWSSCDLCQVIQPGLL